MKGFIAVVTVGSLLLCGCQSTKPLYSYGSYQQNVYEHFKGDDASVTQHIDALQQTIQQANAKNRQVAPGIYAHLGYLYIKAGQVENGLAYLQKEKQLYPESATYIDFLLKNAKAGKK